MVTPPDHPNPCVQALHAQYQQLYTDTISSGAPLDVSLRLFLIDTGHDTGVWRERNWVARLHEYEQFLTTRVPSYRAAIEQPGSVEAVLYRWGKRQLETNATLCEYQYERLVCIPEFADRLDDAPLRARAREYADWVTTNRRQPRRGSTDPDEHRQYQWRAHKRMQWRNRHAPGSRFTANQQHIMGEHLGEGWVADPGADN